MLEEVKEYNNAYERIDNTMKVYIDTLKDNLLYEGYRRVENIYYKVVIDEKYKFLYHIIVSVITIDTRGREARHEIKFIYNSKTDIVSRDINTKLRRK